MNIILYITIIVLILLFSYQLVKYYLYYEGFKLEFDVDWVDKKKLKSVNKRLGMNEISRVNGLAYSQDKANTKYDQLLEFIPDKENYTVLKDVGLMVDIDKPIELNSIEFKNLIHRVDFYRNLESKSRFSNEALNSKAKMILEQESKMKGSSNYPLIRKEISLLKMDRIISTITKEFGFSKEQFMINSDTKKEINLTSKHDLNTSPESLESYKYVKNWLLEEISKQSQKEIYQIKYVDSVRFKFKFDKIINYYIDYDNNLERFEFQGVVYRKNKEHNFFIYFDILFDNKYINYYINNIIILGINIEQYILFADYLDKDYNLDENEVHLSLSDENSSYVTDSYINNYRDTVDDYVKHQEEKQKMEELKNLQNGYCFYKDALDKNTCISFTPDEGVGIWDTPCKYNEDCPFFKKNRNYPNSRGGCVNGFCEMPTNIKTLGYKEYNETGKHSAICYNCNKSLNENGKMCSGIECNQCCEEQKDSRLYPYLVSPDYAFPNDYFERIKYANELEKKSLAPVKIII
jgi:hypothetical protein